MRSSIDVSHPRYPSRLLEQSPYRLRVEGELPTGLAVAIVGTRRASESAAAFAHSLARDLASLGLVVWSGGAVGIDTAAHEGALAAGKPTVVVLGSGLDRRFPPENAALFDKVVETGGALVSIFDDDERARPVQFLMRNKVLAGASSLMVVVECGLRSGARSAAAHARRMQRPIAVVLQAPWSPHGAGCYEEHFVHGAVPIRGADDVLRMLGLDRQLDLFAERSASPVLDGLDELERRIVAAVDDGHDNLDRLCEVLALPFGSVSATVLDLTLRGVVVETTRGLRVGRPG